MLKTIIIVVVIIALAIPVYFFIQGYLSKNGSAAGLTNSQLSRCPDKPNCVNSEFSDDTAHYIDAISYPEAQSENVLNVIKEVIEAQGGEITAENDDYMAAIFTSSIFRFVDDVEIRIARDQQQVHIRSASRVGYSDLDANKNRVERITQAFLDKIK